MPAAYQPLHHKYRPQRFDQLVGQEAIAATLGNALRSGRIAPAYLFSGPRGTGKTSSARILARSLNCLSSDHPTPEPCGSCELCTSIANGNALDVIEIDAASNTGVDNIRELIERSRFAPVQARWKVYVVDECHMLSTAAFNALLKTLEEPPPRVVFVLATTDPQRVLPTILSRCQRFDYRRIPLDALEQHLGWIAKEENIQITPEALHVVAQRAQGGLRDAESLLDQLSLLPGPVEPTAVWELLGAVPEQELLQLAQALAGAEPLGVIEAIRNLLERGREPGAVLQGMAGLLRDLVLAGVAPNRLELTSFSPQIRGELPDLARSIGKATLLRWQAQLKGSEQQLRQSVQPRLWLEVLLLGLLAEPAVAVATSVPTTSPRPIPQATAPTPAAPAPAPPAPDVVVEPIAPPAAAPAPEPVTATSTETPDLAALWQQILAGLELPSTRMLLSQQASLARLDSQRAVVQVAGNWTAMVQSRLPLLEKAVASALGSPRQVVLEAGAAPAAPVAPAPPVPAPQAQTPPPPPEPPQAPPAAATPPQPQTPAPAPAPAEAPTPAPTSAAPAATPAAPPERKPHGLIDDQAKRLAEFFNGEVVDLQDPLPELSDDQAAA
ncbi:DNA polymerase III subunit gamma/tau [Vulcanococcus sp. DEBay_Sum29NL08_54]|uniref:DNA polymerase III subunit gamma/tau n=1 Tax=Vulcanococcus sp. DEBay_Sum29NL08_54 TaxID=2806303 RepID=UPI0025D695F2|nr:DNA polymerase III subunit gamma/tau [Vulcanococcus sp. DEBay_Sum29NL08_54]